MKGAGPKSCGTFGLRLNNIYMEVACHYTN